MGETHKYNVGRKIQENTSCIILLIKKIKNRQNYSMLFKIRTVVTLGVSEGALREPSGMLLIGQILLIPVCSVHENSSSHTLDAYLYVYGTLIQAFNNSCPHKAYFLA